MAKDKQDAVNDDGMKEELEKVYDDTLGLDSGGAFKQDPAYAPDDDDDDDLIDDDQEDDDQDDVDDDDDDNADDDGGEDDDADPDKDDAGADDGQDGDDEKGGSDDEYVRIDPRLVQAGRRSHLDDQTIVQLAEEAPHVLEALANQADLLSEAHAKLGRQADPSDRKGDDDRKQAERKAALQKLKLDTALLDNPDLVGIAKPIQDMVNSLVDKVVEMETKVSSHDQHMSRFEQERVQETSRRIDAFFDQFSKDVPVLGNSSQLNQEAIDARMLAHKVAMGVQMASEGQLSDEEALKIGIQTVKGQTTERQVKERLVRDLQKNRKRFTGRGRGRRQDRRTPRGEDRAFEALNAALDKIEHGG